MGKAMSISPFHLPMGMDLNRNGVKSGMAKKSGSMTKNRLESGKLIGLIWVLVWVMGSSAQVWGQSPCSAGTPYTIVVLGSSTAAGTGPSPVDSAWVWRYRAYVQSINPANQVINLAQGGYTTYQMMPTGYTPPSGRPNPDTLKNITRALSLNPDAIIINFPSNDVSQGFSVQEQLRNDSTVWAIAQAANVPVWISTTQPKNFSIGSVNIQKQMEVRDSIFARYGSHALDFWSVIADSNGQIVPAYNSGDGTHLNNAGHWILFNRVKDAHILDSLYTPPPYVDHFALGLEMESLSACGDPNTNITFQVANGGMPSLADMPIVIKLTHLGSGSTQTFRDTLVGGQPSCSLDSFVTSFNTSIGGDFLVEAYVDLAADGNHGNDTLRQIRHYSGIPQMVVQGDTSCGNTALFLAASTGGTDHFFWYNSPVSSTPIAQGPQWITPILASSTTYWVEAVRGNLFYSNSLATTETATVNWNGAMLDLIATQSLVVDSFYLKFNSLGTQLVRAYAKNGSHLGSVNNPAAWTYLGERTVNVIHPDSMVSVAWDTLPMNAGDTLGIYFHMTNSGSTLRYRSIASPISRSTSELEIRTGTGVSYTFGTSYYPRDLNCEVFYHFGYRPGGDCSTGRQPVEAVVSIPAISIGPDTILDVNTTYTLTPQAGFAHYLWSTGDTTPNLVLDGNVLGAGIYTIRLTATDSAGCAANDTAIIVFAPLVGQTNANLPAVWRVWPNPSAGNIHYSIPNLPSDGGAKITLTDLTGRRLETWEVSTQSGQLNLQGIVQGTYFLTLEVQGQIPVSLMVQIGAF